jgi:hypothetical protein
VSAEGVITRSEATTNDPETANAGALSPVAVDYRITGCSEKCAELPEQPTRQFGSWIGVIPHGRISSLYRPFSDVLDGVLANAPPVISHDQESYREPVAGTTN